MKHHFDTVHAKLFGIESAVLIDNIDFWIQKNKANGRHLYEGRYWTYNSVKAWIELFPYMTKDVIRKRLDFLVEKGVLLKGNFSDDRRDRTTWYTLRMSALHPAQEPNAFVQEANSSLYTDSKHTDTTPEENSGPQKALFTGTPEIKNSDVKKKKKEGPADECFAEFVKAWTDSYPELGFNGVSGSKINLLITKTKKYRANAGLEYSKDQTVGMFQYVLAYIKRVNHFCHGKPITTLDSQYLSIIFEIKNGKSAGKKQSAHDFISGLQTY